MFVIDPTDNNQAILDDGALGFAVRVIKILDPKAPTVAELDAGTVIGYANPAGWTNRGADKCASD